MAHFTRTLPDATWINGYVPTGANLDSLDGKTVKAINGDGGGSWSPATAITIGGAGVRMIGATLGMNAGNVLPAAGKKIRFGNSDYFKKAYATSHMVALSDAIHQQDQRGQWRISTLLSDSGVQSMQPGYKMRAQIRVHDGSTLYLARFYYRIYAVHVAIPSQLPQFRVFRVDMSGVEEPMGSGAGIGPAGWVTLTTPANVAAYNAGGGGGGSAVQSFDYTVNLNNVIDVSKYRYYVEIIEEAGSGNFRTIGVAEQGNDYSHVLLGSSGITDMRFQ